MDMVTVGELNLYSHKWDRWFRKVIQECIPMFLKSIQINIEIALIGCFGFRTLMLSVEPESYDDGLTHFLINSR